MRTTSKIIEKSLYQNPQFNILYGIGQRNICEYDMNSAGFSVIKVNNMLERRDIMRLESMDKKERNIVIGKIRGYDKEWSKRFSSLIRMTMKDFIINNEINDEDIISINNDAVTILQSYGKSIKMESDGVTFKRSGCYKNMVVLSRVSFFSDSQEINVKGISESGRENTKDFMQKMIFGWMKRLDEGEDKYSVIKDIERFRILLLTKKLPLGFYRNLRNGNIELSGMFSKYTKFSVSTDFIDDEWKVKLDTSANIIDFVIPFINLLV